MSWSRGIFLTRGEEGAVLGRETRPTEAHGVGREGRVVLAAGDAQLVDGARQQHGGRDLEG